MKAAAGGARISVATYDRCNSHVPHKHGVSGGSKGGRVLAADGDEGEEGAGGGELGGGPPARASARAAAARAAQGMATAMRADAADDETWFEMQGRGDGDEDDGAGGRGSGRRGGKGRGRGRGRWGGRGRGRSEWAVPPVPGFNGGEGWGGAWDTNSQGGMPSEGSDGAGGMARRDMEGGGQEAGDRGGEAGAAPGDGGVTEGGVSLAGWGGGGGGHPSAAAAGSGRVRMMAPVRVGGGPTGLTRRNNTKHQRLFAGEPGALVQGERLCYKTNQGDVLLEGTAMVSPDASGPRGILCKHCGKVVSCSAFEAHAGKSGTSGKVAKGAVVWAKGA